MLVCDFARDFRLLTCRHCGKTVKQLKQLVDHLRTHGVKRFLCSLCDYCAVQANVVKTHLKNKHEKYLTREVRIKPGPGIGPALPENMLISLCPLKTHSRLNPSRKRDVAAIVVLG